MKASLGIEAIGYETYQQARSLRGAIANGRANPAELARTLSQMRRCFQRPAPGDGVSRPWWVARITGASSRRGWHYEYLQASVDYTNANSVGTRGVMLYFILESGQVYHVQHTPTWGRTAQYFCRVTEAGDIEEISREEVLEWLATPKSPSA
jgi:hypothetical protein